MTNPKIGTGQASPNIALIKYWGKSDVSLNIPTNKSLSITTKNLSTKTEVSEGNDKDAFFLNGKKEVLKERHKTVISEFKRLAKYNKYITIKSVNNFPHSCGLASSASGFAALVLALNDFFSLKLSCFELSKLARLGSGSASRSIFGGINLFVGDGATQIDDWNEIRIFVVVVKNSIKAVGSTEGMKRTVETSDFFKERLKRIDEKIEAAKKAIFERNFEDLAILTMKESNELHSVILNSWPPFFYLNDESFKIIDLCVKFNENGIKVAYTFDAGPNAFILTLNRDFNDVYDYFRCNVDYEIIVAL